MPKSKTIRIGLTPADIGHTIKEFEAWRTDLESKTKEFLKALAEAGVQVASVNFQSAVYDGTNDVVVSFDEKSDTTIAVVATGEATLFIEFGSGIVYPDDHPEGTDLGMIRGEYGYGQGANIWGWTYWGEPGTNGMIINQGWQRGKVHTFGNPANMAMYRSKEELENEFANIARRVFK